MTREYNYSSVWDYVQNVYEDGTIIDPYNRKEHLSGYVRFSDGAIASDKEWNRHANRAVAYVGGLPDYETMTHDERQLAYVAYMRTHLPLIVEADPFRDGFMEPL